MRPSLILLLAALLLPRCVLSQNDRFYFGIPGSVFNGYYSGNLIDVSFEVTPKATYAQVDMTLTFSPILAPPNDSLEALLYFDLPANSYIHDSWLWLNDTTIISADIVERNKAVQVYTGIVKRRRDPSLLINCLEQTYCLSVYPCTYAYKRKVKISYSTPFIWRNGHADVTLPFNVLGASYTKPGVAVQVHTDSYFLQPSFIEKSFSSVVVSQTANVYTLSVPATHYITSDLTLSYTLAGGGQQPLLATYATGATEGYYQLMVPPAIPIPANRKLAIIIDQYPSQYGSLHYHILKSVASVKAGARSFLLANLNATDSFTIFYSDSSGPRQSLNGWKPATPAFINAAIDGVPGTISPFWNQFQSLLKTAFLFAKASPGAESVVISSNEEYHNINGADTLYSSIASHIGGFTTANKASVINNSRNSFTPAQGMSPQVGNGYLFNKLCSATGGSYYCYGATYNSTLYQQFTLFELDIKGMLRDIWAKVGTATSAYNISIPVNGFSAATYDISGQDKFSPSRPFVETGKYFGSFQPGGCSVQYISAGNLVTNNYSQITTYAGTYAMQQAWVSHYLKDLLQSTFNNAEVLDSSMNNRVLCGYTAFLALETGDTIKSSYININSGISAMSTPPDDIRVYPNPAEDVVSIEALNDILNIELNDFTGRVIASIRYNGNSRKEKVQLGRYDLVPGIYLLRVTTASSVFTVKIQKS